MNRRILDKVYDASLAIKAIDGAFELIGAALLFAVRPATIGKVVSDLTQHELSTNPHDYIATHLLQTSQHLASSGRVFGILFLVAHGLLKIGLAMALLRSIRWAYPVALVFLSLFILYEVYRIGFTHSIVLTIFTLFDCLLVWLVYKEMRLPRAEE